MGVGPLLGLLTVIYGKLSLITLSICLWSSLGEGLRVGMTDCSFGDFTPTFLCIGYYRYIIATCTGMYIFYGDARLPSHSTVWLCCKEGGCFMR